MKKYLITLKPFIHFIYYENLDVMKVLIVIHTSSKWKVGLLSRKSKQREREEKSSGMLRIRVEVAGGGEDNW